MSQSNQQLSMSFTAKIVRALLRSQLRGRTRLAIYLATRLHSLQEIPVSVEDSQTVYVDLRVSSSHCLFAGNFPECDERQLMRRIVKPGQIVLDIGAHLGLHTTLLAHLVGLQGRVHAFEPNPRVLPCLRRTIAGLPNTTLHAMALSDHTDATTLFIPADDTMASLVDWTPEEFGSVREVTCAQLSLDDFVVAGTIPYVDFIKCDVEGGETFVFQGAIKLLNRVNAPVLLFELNQKACSAFRVTTDNVLSFLRGLDKPQYTFFEISHGPSIRLLDSQNIQYANVLAVPQDKLAHCGYLVNCSG